jgi:hypothetical protein
MRFRRFFSVDNPKAVKAQALGWLNAINYMAPHRLAGVGNLCPNASAGCIALCLGEHSGNATLYPTVLKSRIRKARWFMTDRKAFLAEMVQHIERAKRDARKARLKLAVRLNGATDIAWEGVARDVFAAFPTIQFLDYTKSVQRALAHAQGKLPPNYHLTFSRSETNWSDCVRVLAAGGNVAVVSSCPMPALYRGWSCVDGDQSDLRHLDACGGERRSLVVWLSPKGAKAKASRNGFVLRSLT